MRIISILMDGFGIFHEASLENLPEGLILISGDNEAGKSTLLGFIRAILFGFSDGRTNENLYEPLAGGQHGGRITVMTDKHDEVIIERKAGKKGGPVDLLFKKDGSRGSEDELRQLLGGFNKVIYKNIYAFSLGELQTFDSLNAEDVRGALYGAGSGTSLMAIPESMKKLEKGLDNLFKPGGSKPLINTKLADVEEVRKKIREAIDGIKHYETLVLNRQNISGRIEQLQQAGDAFQKNQNRVENYLKLWDQWIVFQDAQTKRENLPYIVSEFPNEGLVRLNNLNHNLETLIKSRVNTARNEAELKIQLKTLSVDDLLISYESKIFELREDLTRYMDSLKQLSEDRQAVKQINIDIHRELDNLGSDWTTERVYSIDRSLFTQNAIRQYQSSRREAKSELEKAEDALKQVKEQYESARQEAETTQNELQKFKDLKSQVDRKMLSAIQNGRNQFASIVTDLPKRKMELTDAQRNLKQAIREIDPGWRTSEAESFDCSVPAQEKIQRFELEMDAVKNRIDEAKTRLEFEASNLSNIQRELKVNEEKYQAISKPSLKTRDEFVSRKNDVRSLRGYLNKKELLIESILHHEERRADKQNTLLKSLPQISTPLPEYVKWLSIALFSAGLVMIGIVSVLFENLLVGGITGGVLSTLGMGLFLTNRLVKRQSSKKDFFDQTNIEIEKDIEKIKEKHKQLNDELAEVKLRLEKLISVLGISTNVELGDIDKIENRIEIDLNLFVERSRLEEESNRIRERKNQIKDTLDKMTENLESLEETYRKLQENWEQQLDQLCLKPGTKPRTVNLIFTKVDGIKTIIKNIRNQEERIKEMVLARDEYRGLLKQVPGLSGHDPVDLNELLSVVDRFLEHTKRMEKRRQERDLVDRTLEEKQRSQKNLSDKFNKAEQRFREAVDQQNRDIDAWQKWLSNNGLDREVSPETALDALGTINKCIQFIDAKSKLAESIRQRVNIIESYLDLSITLFTKLGKAKPDPDKLGTEVKLLSQELEKNKIDLTKKNSVKDQLKRILREIDSIKQEIDIQKAEIRKLVQESGAKDEETFRNQGELFKKGQALLSEIENATKNMKIISGESDIETLMDILKKYTKEELDSENRMLQKNIREVKDDLESERQELAEIKNKIEILSSSDDISRFRAEEERLMEEIRSAARRWGIHAIARYLLSLARERFEKEHQPKVIKAASSFFKTFTGGEYQKIIAPLGTHSIEVLNGWGKQKEPQQLSRATAEQLFLALRFGYIMNYAENNEVLPVIMDDILVNFDTARSRNTSEAILGLAKSHQVLFFTCHPETLSIFKKQQADVPVYRIENGNFRMTENA